MSVNAIPPGYVCFQAVTSRRAERCGGRCPKKPGRRKNPVEVKSRASGHAKETPARACAGSAGRRRPPMRALTNLFILVSEGIVIATLFVDSLSYSDHLWSKAWIHQDDHNEEQRRAVTRVSSVLRHHCLSETSDEFADFWIRTSIELKSSSRCKRGWGLHQRDEESDGAEFDS